MQKALGLVAFAIISLTSPQLALAQNSSQGETWSTKHAQVKNELEQAGYKDVRIIPLSYLVEATDKGGNPAMMVITPNSMTAITDMGISIAIPKSQ
jgi:Peptidase propeptide and YPEB domain